MVDFILKKILFVVEDTNTSTIITETSQYIWHSLHQQKTNVKTLKKLNMDQFGKL